MSRLPWLILLLAGSLIGCNLLAFPLWVLAPELKDTVPAEYDGLANHSVAIVVYADYDVLYSYPYARTELATTVGQELTRTVEGIRVVDPQRVVAYQDQNIYWDTMPMPELGETLGADRVLYISLSEYTTREPGSTTLVRGRIQATASAWESPCPDGTDGLVWEKNDLAVTWPSEGPLGVLTTNDRPVRQETVRQFAVLLAKSFYSYNVPRYGDEAMERP